MGGYKKGLEWNKNQLLVAKLLNEGKTPYQAALEVGVSDDTAYRVQKAILDGDVPPSLDPDFIAKAKKPTKVGVKADASKVAEAIAETPPPPPSKPGETPPIDTKVNPHAAAIAAATAAAAAAKKVLPLTNQTSKAAILQLIPQVQQLPMTPDIYMSYYFALVNGYEGQIGDWINLCCRDFWFGRGVDFFAGISEIAHPPGDGKKEEVLM